MVLVDDLNYDAMDDAAGPSGAGAAAASSSGQTTVSKYGEYFLPSAETMRSAKLRIL